MIKRLTIAAAALVSMFFAAPAMSASAAPVHSTTSVHIAGCPAPQVMHPDGTCWP